MAPIGWSQGKSFSPRATLLIALCLLVPEVLRLISGSLEPFPAVLLPAGAGKVRLTDGRLRMKHVLVEAEREGSWREVDRAALLDPLPVHYFGEIVRGKFGFHDRAWRGLTAPPPATTPEAQHQTKAWLRARLESLGFQPARLRVVEESYFLHLPSGEHSAVKRERETTFELD